MANLLFVLLVIVGVGRCVSLGSRTGTEVHRATESRARSLADACCGICESLRERSLLTPALPPGTDDTLTTKGAIRSILQDRHGNLWFGSDGEGAYRYDGASVTRFSEKEGLGSNVVREIVEDDIGGMWFSSGDCVSRYDGSSFIIVTGTHARPKSGSVRPASRKNLWFSAGPGAYRYDGFSLNYVALGQAAIDSVTRDATSDVSQRAYSVYSLMFDRSGNIWFGTDHRGVCRYDGVRFTYLSEMGLDKSPVRSLYQDRDDNLWFGTNGEGVFRFDGTSMTNFTDDHGLSNHAFAKDLKDKTGNLARVFSITQDSAGNVWFGTVDGGVWRYDGSTLDNFTVNDGLPGNAVWSICEDRSGNLWFGTDGGGVARFDGHVVVDMTTMVTGR